jgi:hypothetical protein
MYCELYYQHRAGLYSFIYLLISYLFIQFDALVVKIAGFAR